ncbi:MAG: MBL fold metallo-hydrolase [Candidatus Electryoneaceae bacterium]|nr:MBL fold metallo-hydrolase [Candidatus Electryoneaceae bacterium]
MKFTIVFDNYPYSILLRTGFGFACVVETGDRKILFDTGSDGGVLLNNLSVVDISPQEIGTVVISHNHWDHIDGLQDFLRVNSDIDLYVPVSFPDHFKAGVKKSGVRLIEVDESCRICDGIYSTGEMRGIMNEQSLICKTDQGSVVITGCAHPGIVKIIKRAIALHGPVVLAMGGFHLRDKRQSSIKGIVQLFKELGVGEVCPSHCTGDDARSLFQKIYGQHCILGGVGSTFNF